MKRSRWDSPIAAAVPVIDPAPKRPLPRSPLPRPAAPTKPSSRLYVGNLHRSVTEANIIQLFLKHGRIVKEQFFWHTSGPKRGEPRGFCFIEYSNEAEARQAMHALDRYPLKGRMLQVRYSLESEVQVTDPRIMLARAKARAEGKTSVRESGRGAEAQKPGEGQARWELDQRIQAVRRKLSSLQQEEVDGDR